MKNFQKILCAVIFLFTASVSEILFAEMMKPLDGNNLALGKKAVFSLKPNYGDCMGGDETDLTDGKFWEPGRGPIIKERRSNLPDALWNSKGSVGWSFGRKPGVFITFDLEEIQPIETVGFDTAAEPDDWGDITFPAAILVYVSDDGKSWHYVTDLFNEAVAQNKAVRHRFTAKGLKTSGRHVTVYFAKGGWYGVVDEIEILRGRHNPSSVSFSSPGIEQAGLEKDVENRKNTAFQNKTTLYFIETARDRVKSSSGSAKAKKSVLKKLDIIQKLAFDRVETEEVDFSGGLPYTNLDRQVCETMGMYFRESGGKTVVLWKPSDSFWRHTTGPFARPDMIQPPELHAHMMIGEYEPVAFNVSNNTEEPVTIRIQLSNLKGSVDNAVWNHTKVERRISTHVMAIGYLFFDDALPHIQSGLFTIPPGMTRQVWLILHSRDVTSQEYSGTVTVSVSEDNLNFKIPLTATVYPIEMPENPSYTTNAWSYFTWLPAKGHEWQAAAEMERCYQNAHVLHHAYIPWPKVDSDTKKLVRPVELEFTKFDEMIEYRPYVKQWLLWPGFDFGYFHLNYYQATDMPKIGTPEHETLFKEWVCQIRDHMKEKGYPTTKWAFYWDDEPGDTGFKEKVVPASKLAKEVDPSIIIWEDHQATIELLEKYPDAVDIHCCPLSYYRRKPDILKHANSEKLPSVHYECSSWKSQDPHQYYRLHHLSAVDIGLDGAGMWVWGDSGGQFNDYYAEHPGYGMVFASDSGPVTTKRREAWREGIEDAELWRHLNEKAKKSGDASLTKLYKESLQRILNITNFDHVGTTPGEMLEIRLEILRTLAGN